MPDVWDSLDAWLTATKITPAHITTVKRFLGNLREQYHLLPVPVVAVSDGDDDGVTVNFSWDTGALFLDFNVFENGSFHWFFRDRRTKELDGTDDDPAKAITDDIKRRLELFVSVPGSA